MTDSKAEHEPRGNHHQAQAPTSWWTIVWVLASWVAIGMTWYAVHAQTQNARKLLQTQIAVELDKQFDSADMRRAVAREEWRGVRLSSVRLLREDRGV